MSFPTAAKGRARSSSFNHSTVIRRQQSDSTFQLGHYDPQHRLSRRPSFDSHNTYQVNKVVLPKSSHSNFLAVNQNAHNVASSIDDDSGSEEYDYDNGSIYPQSQFTTNTANQLDNQSLSGTEIVDYYVDSPTPITPVESNTKEKSTLKEKMNSVSRKSSKSTNSNKKSGVFGTKLLASKSTSSTTSQQLYDDGSNAIYPPPPQKKTKQQSGQRDQYGFLKNSQWITEDEFNGFENNYAPIMKRRLLKWRQLLSDNNNQWPERSSKIKRYIRKGIPPELRGQAWLHYSGAKRRMDKNKGFYDDLVQRAEEMGAKNENLDIIERDLHRTFPENIKFRPYETTSDKEKMNIPIIQSLRRLLLAFSLFSPTIGYCQSLNYIAGMLLLFMNEEEAFWTFVQTITEILPPNIYDVTMEGANIDQNVLMILLSERYPQLWNRISGGKSFWECEEDGTGMPTCSLVTSHWFLTLYINILPTESVLRVWDCLFYDGQKVLFRIALGIFKLNENEILAVSDPLEVFQVIQNMPKRMVDCHKLIDGTYQQFAASTRVSDEEIRDRRELFRKRRDERRRNIPVQNGRKLLKRGTMRGAIVHKAKEAKWVFERAKTVRK